MIAEMGAASGSSSSSSSSKLPPVPKLWNNAPAPQARPQTTRAPAAAAAGERGGGGGAEAGTGRHCPPPSGRNERLSIEQRERSGDGEGVSAGLDAFMAPAGPTVNSDPCLQEAFVRHGRAEMEANVEIALQDAIRSAIQNHNQGEDDGKAKPAAQGASGLYQDPDRREEAHRGEFVNK